MIKKKRIIILGAGSFVISEFVKNLKKHKMKFIPINKKKIDLVNRNSIKKLDKVIRKGDSVIFASAIAPVKTIKMLNDNLRICTNVFSCLKKKKIGYLLYISSDAVYSDSLHPLKEISETKPNNLHGFMHLMRENILKFLDTRFCIVRPTLVYGSEDPHNGYGPNQFIRLAQSKKKISLFGKGEEKRDHVHVKDVGDSIFYLFKKRYAGVANIVSGKTNTFFEIAKKINDNYGNKLKFVKRKGPMPHNGYRAFNNKMLKKLVKKNKFKNILDWIDNKEKYKKIK